MTPVQPGRAAPTNLAAKANRTPPPQLREILTACADVPRWVELVLTGRPYADDAALLATATAAADGFTPDEIDRALAAHPRIGDRPAGGSTEAGWSRREQAGVADDRATADALRAANAQYEDRFGRVFLICASGLSAPQILQAAQHRLRNDPDTELGVVGAELAKIALLRLEKALAW